MKKHYGYIKWYVLEKNFGFIHEFGGDDFFVANIEDFKPEQNDIVVFELVERERGIEAVNVKLYFMGDN